MVKSDIKRLMFEVEPEQALIETLVALAAAENWSRAFVRATGTLDLVEIAAQAGETVMFESVDILSLTGQVDGASSPPAVKLQVIIMTPSGLQAGKLCAAMTGKMLLVVDAEVERAPETVGSRGSAPGTAAAAAQVATRAAMPSEARSAPSPSASPTPRPSQPKPAKTSPAAGRTATPFGSQSARVATQPLSQSFSTKPQVTKIARKVEVFDDDDDEIIDPEPGDRLVHPQLGLCEVVGDDDSGGVRVRVPSGHVRVLHLDALRIAQSTADEQGRRVFKVLGPRRR